MPMMTATYYVASRSPAASSGLAASLSSLLNTSPLIAGIECPISPIFSSNVLTFDHSYIRSSYPLASFGHSLWSTFSLTSPLFSSFHVHTKRTEPQNIDLRQRYTTPLSPATIRSGNAFVPYPSTTSPFRHRATFTDCFWHFP